MCAVYLRRPPADASRKAGNSSIEFTSDPAAALRSSQKSYRRYFRRSQDNAPRLARSSLPMPGSPNSHLVESCGTVSIWRRVTLIVTLRRRSTCSVARRCPNRPRKGKLCHERSTVKIGSCAASTRWERLRPSRAYPEPPFTGKWQKEPSQPPCRSPKAVSVGQRVWSMSGAKGFRRARRNTGEPHGPTRPRSPVAAGSEALGPARACGGRGSSAFLVLLVGRATANSPPHRSRADCPRSPCDLAAGGA